MGVGGERGGDDSGRVAQVIHVVAIVVDGRGFQLIGSINLSRYCLDC